MTTRDFDPNVPIGKRGGYPPLQRGGPRPGGLLIRFAARLVDAIVCLIVTVWIGEILRLTGSVVQGVLLGLLTFEYFVLFEIALGWTPAKKLFGLRTNGPAYDPSAANPFLHVSKPNLRESAIRNRFLLLVAIPYIGVLVVVIPAIMIAVSIGRSPTKQGTHDVNAGGTQVVLDWNRRSTLIAVSVAVAVALCVTTLAQTTSTLSAITPATQTSLGEVLTIPVGQHPDEVAIDPGTHVAYVTNSADNTVSVLDPVSRTVSATIPIGNYPFGAAVDPGSHLVWVTSGHEPTVSVLDPASRTVSAPIVVGANPVSVAVDPGNHSVYVVNHVDNTVSVLDATSHATIATIPVGQGPNSVAVDPVSHFAYVANVGGNTVSVLDPETRTVSATIPVGHGPMAVAVDPGNHAVYVANQEDTVSVLDTFRRTVSATIPVANGPVAVAVDPVSHAVYVLNFYPDPSLSVLDPASRTITTTIPVGRDPNDVEVDPSSHTVYVVNTTDATVSVLQAHG